MKTAPTLTPPKGQPPVSETSWLLVLVGLTLLPRLSSACPVCRPRVQAAIHTADYAATAWVVLLPVAVLLALGLALYWAESLWPRRNSATSSPQLV